KAIGDMQERMRSVAIIMRRDLRAFHFQQLTGPPRGLGLSDQDLRNAGAPPDQGYSRLWQQFNQGSPAPYYQGSIYEGQDADGLVSTRATQTWMAFTIYALGTTPDTFLPAALPNVDPAVNGQLAALCPVDLRQANNTTMLSQWAEVAYFLKPLLNADGT